MASHGYDIAKAGWLYRQSSILHRWKRNWFTLDRQGDLRYFENPDSPRAEERIVVRAVVHFINAGYDCRSYNPPEGLNKASCGFLELKMAENSLVLCSDSFDDMKAWHVALEEARAMNRSTYPYPQTYVQAPNYVVSGPTYRRNYRHVCAPIDLTSPMGGYPGRVLSTSTPQVYTHYGQPGTTHVTLPQQVVIVDDDPYRYRYRYGPRMGGGFIW